MDQSIEQERDFLIPVNHASHGGGAASSSIHEGFRSITV
jgi:hypothetical protein